MIALRRVSAPLLLFATIAALHVGLFSIAATRGWDLTDESFYLLSFRHWAEAPATSFFGAYLAMPYALVGQSLWAIRVVGFLLLFGTSVRFVIELIRSLNTLEDRTSRGHIGAAAIAASTAVWSYYGAFPVPYTPSYNLVELACALASSALSLRLGRTIFLRESRGLVREAFLLGFVASIGIATKFTGGVLVLGLNVLALSAFSWRRLDARTASRVGLALSAGLLSNFAVLAAADHDLVTRFQRGIAIALAVMPRAPIAELASFALGELPRDLALAPRILMWPLLFATVVGVLGPRLCERRLSRGISVTALVLGAMLVIYVKENRTHRFALLTLFAISLALGLLWMRRRTTPSKCNGRAALLGISVISLPFAYAFGTSNILLWQMGMAAIFPSALAVSSIYAMRSGELIPTWAFVVSLGFLAVFPACLVIGQWLEGRDVYRLGAPLANQTARLPLHAAGIDVGVEPRVAKGAGAFLDLAHESGFTAGQPMIDFTGQSPGLILITGGTPLGAIWLVGGPPFNGDLSAKVALDYVNEGDVRRAWLLTSRDSFTRIASWKSIVERKVGDFAYDEVGRVTLPNPSSNDKEKTVEVTLWRPRH